MKTIIVRNHPRADLSAARRLGEFGVATVHEAQGRSGLMRPYMRPVYPQARVGGTAITVLCHPGDNLMLHAAFEIAGPGDVLVVTTTSDCTDGMFGDLMATLCQTRGIAGLVMDAGVRDTSDITAMGFPVWSKAVSAQGTVKATPGCVNVPVVCAGVTVHPGDVVVGDQDGVVVVPRESVAGVLLASAVRVEKEAVTRERLRAGELTLDISDLRGILKELGVEYVD